jgi:hypothetical protein
MDYSERRHKILLHYQKVLEEMWTLEVTTRKRLSDLETHLTHPPESVRRLFDGYENNLFQTSITMLRMGHKYDALDRIYTLLDREEFRAIDVLQNRPQNGLDGMQLDQGPVLRTFLEPTPEQRYRAQFLMGPKGRFRRRIWDDAEDEEWRAMRAANIRDAGPGRV